MTVTTENKIHIYRRIVCTCFVFFCIDDSSSKYEIKTKWPRKETKDFD